MDSDNVQSLNIVTMLCLFNPSFCVILTSVYYTSTITALIGKMKTKKRNHYLVSKFFKKNCQERRVFTKETV